MGPAAGLAITDASLPPLGLLGLLLLTCCAGPNGISANRDLPCHPEPGIQLGPCAPAGLHLSGDGSGGKMRVKATGGGAYKYAEVRATGGACQCTGGQVGWCGNCCECSKPKALHLEVALSLDSGIWVNSAATLLVCCSCSSSGWG